MRVLAQFRETPVERIHYVSWARKLNNVILPEPTRGVDLEQDYSLREAVLLLSWQRSFASCEDASNELHKDFD